jgi:hypothetical protein
MTMRKKEYNDSIEKRIMDTYPVTKKEKRCRIEKGKREYMRAELRKRLYNEKETSEETNEGVETD